MSGDKEYISIDAVEELIKSNVVVGNFSPDKAERLLREWGELKEKRAFQEISKELGPIVKLEVVEDVGRKFTNPCLYYSVKQNYFQTGAITLEPTLPPKYHWIKEGRSCWVEHFEDRGIARVETNPKFCSSLVHHFGVTVRWGGDPKHHFFPVNQIKKEP